MTTYLVALDGIAISNSMGEFLLANPFLELINFVSQLFDKGQYIVIHSAFGIGGPKNINDVANQCKDFT